MIIEVNKEGCPGEVTFKYLEKGYTFMSADFYHAKFEHEVRKVKNIFDGNKFTAINHSTGHATEMQCNDFIPYENGVSQVTPRALFEDGNGSSGLKCIAFSVTFFVRKSPDW